MANEKRLIDANALLEKMQFSREVTDAYLEAVRHCVLIGRSLVKNAPTVDAVQVVHGRWVEVDDGVMIGKGIHFECSKCGTWGSWGRLSKYCPNCGAKMDGDGNV